MLINIKYVANKLSYFCLTKWDREINLQTFQTQNPIPTADFFSEDAFEEADITTSLDVKGLILYFIVPGVQTAYVTGPYFAREYKNLNMRRNSVINKGLNIAYFQQVSAPTWNCDMLTLTILYDV